MIIQNLKIAVILIACIVFTSTAGKSQEISSQLLTQQNFEKITLEIDQYKFITFIKKDCRFCGLIKQVENELRHQKDWSFKFYTVDCSSQIDLCHKLEVKTWPFMLLYNDEGLKNGQIGGYYSINIMRDAYKLIQKRIKNKTIEDEIKTNIKMQNIMNTTQQNVGSARNNMQSEQVQQTLNQILTQRDEGIQQENRLNIFGRSIKIIGLAVVFVIVITIFKNVLFSVDQITNKKILVLQMPCLNNRLNVDIAKKQTNSDYQDNCDILGQDRL